MWRQNKAHTKTQVLHAQRHEHANAKISSHQEAEYQHAPSSVQDLFGPENPVWLVGERIGRQLHGLAHP